MPAPIVPDWGAFHRSDERHKKADGTPSNKWMAYCRACEAAHKKYLEDVSACNCDRAAIANIAVVPPAEPLPGRRDRMTPHLNKCAFVKQSSPTDGADDELRNGGPSGVHHSLGRASSAVDTPREQEADLLTRLGITKYQFDGVRAYMEYLAADSGQGREKRHAELRLHSFFSRELTASKRAELEKRVLVLVADQRLSFSAVEHSSFENLVRLLRPTAVAHLPSRRQLAGRILHAAASEASTHSKAAVVRLLQGSARATLMLDGCKRSNNTHVLGAVLGIAEERLVLDSEDEGHQHDGISTAAATAGFIDRLAGEGEIRVGCGCTDDAGHALSSLIAEVGQAAPTVLQPSGTPDFWEALQSAEWVARPLAFACFVLERNHTTLADALLVYGTGCFAKWFPGESSRADAIVQQTFDFLTGDVTATICTPSLKDVQTYGSAGWTWY
ncbi:hypothetical protein I4F81_003023 [Pyropia yezoensis]|uniref:Uncharacterized protein n=1 Tax=Pyropia yezoensis TaxID=2788 RepID=A0ACC3BR01_PYRYE|nr:hypothetical protein I4F81_003023 [Neopyropia yezoensis]